IVKVSRTSRSGGGCSPPVLNAIANRPSLVLRPRTGSLRLMFGRISMMRAEVKYWRNSVIKRRIKLHRFSALGIGLSAACLALACGSNDKTSDETTDHVGE